jgi:hypothetical protein
MCHMFSFSTCMPCIEIKINSVVTINFLFKEFNARLLVLNYVYKLVKTCQVFLKVVSFWM